MEGAHLFCYTIGGGNEETCDDLRPLCEFKNGSCWGVKNNEKGSVNSASDLKEELDFCRGKEESFCNWLAPCCLYDNLEEECIAIPQAAVEVTICDHPDPN